MRDLPFIKQSENVDPSYKTAIDFSRDFDRVNLLLKPEEIWHILWSIFC